MIDKLPPLPEEWSRFHSVDFQDEDERQVMLGLVEERLQADPDLGRIAVVTCDRDSLRVRVSRDGRSESVWIIEEGWWQPCTQAHAEELAHRLAADLKPSFNA